MVVMLVLRCGNLSQCDWNGKASWQFYLELHRNFFQKYL